jgi:hypothetical protein
MTVTAEQVATPLVAETENGWPGGPKTFFMPRVGQPGKHKWVFSAVWLVYLVGPVVSVVQSDKPLWWKLLNYTVVGAFVVAYRAAASSARRCGGGTPLRSWSASSR